MKIRGKETITIFFFGISNDKRGN